MTTMNDYQRLANRTAIYPGRLTDWGLGYVALGLTGEAGEFANKVKKIIRDGGDVDGLGAELGDVLWYVAVGATELGYTLEDIAGGNLAKLASRAQRGTLGGNGDHR